MQELLTFDQAPPVSAPFRFFLTAPVFAILAGLLLLWSGPDLFASRWTPEAVALTHLITVGFMMQAMFGAMMQVLPVVAGANIARPLLVATVVHTAITLGALLLATAFLSHEAMAFGAAAGFLGFGVAVFVAMSAKALNGLSTTNPTIRGVKLALVGLSVTVGFGLLLALSLGWSFALPLLQLTDIHLSWGLLTWGCVLLAAVGFVVVPMFQMTPAYSDWFSRYFSIAALALLTLWSIVDLAGFELLSTLLGGAIVLAAALFAAITLKIQHQSKRAKFDSTQHYWRLAMLSTLAACLLWAAVRGIPALADWHGWPLLCGVLLLVGGFMSVIMGMLYKIFPFLIWMHLQNLGRGRLMAPNMKKVLAEAKMKRQMQVHFAAFALLLLSVFWPQWFVYPAGLALIASSLLLLQNMLSAIGVYRQHLAKIVALNSAGQ